MAIYQQPAAKDYSGDIATMMKSMQDRITQTLQKNSGQPSLWDIGSAYAQSLGGSSFSGNLENLLTGRQNRAMQNMDLEMKSMELGLRALEYNNKLAREGNSTANIIKDTLERHGINELPPEARGHVMRFINEDSEAFGDPYGNNDAIASRAIAKATAMYGDLTPPTYQQANIPGVGPGGKRTTALGFFNPESGQYDQAGPATPADAPHAPRQPHYYTGYDPSSPTGASEMEVDAYGIPRVVGPTLTPSTPTVPDKERIEWEGKQISAMNTIKQGDTIIERIEKGAAIGGVGDVLSFIGGVSDQAKQIAEKLGGEQVFNAEDYINPSDSTEAAVLRGQIMQYVYQRAIDLNQGRGPITNKDIDNALSSIAAGGIFSSRQAVVSALRQSAEASARNIIGESQQLGKPLIPYFQNWGRGASEAPPTSEDRSTWSDEQIKKELGIP